MTGQHVGEVVGAEVIHPAHLVEAHDGVLGVSASNEDQGGEHHDSQSLHEEGVLLGIDLDEPGLQVGGGESVQVSIDDLTPRSRAPKEVYHHSLGLLGDFEELLGVVELHVPGQVSQMAARLIDQCFYTSHDRAVSSLAPVGPSSEEQEVSSAAALRSHPLPSPRAA